MPWGGYKLLNQRRRRWHTRAHGFSIFAHALFDARYPAASSDLQLRVVVSASGIKITTHLHLQMGSMLAL